MAQATVESRGSRRSPLEMAIDRVWRFFCSVRAAVVEIIILAVLVLLGVASAQDWARAELEKSPRRQDWAQIQSGNRTVDTFVVFPEAKTKAPVVLVLHPIQGMNEWVQNIADQFAAKGYVAMAPDFLSGLGPSGGASRAFFERGQIEKAAAKLSTEQVMRDLSAVADLAKMLPAGNGKVVVVGFGWGGEQAFNFATRRPDLNAAFVFNTGVPVGSVDLSKINAAVYRFYSGNDKDVSSTIPQTKQKMQQAGKTFEAISYEGANSNFMLSAEAPYPTTFDVEARRQAWQRMLNVLKGM